MKISRKRKTINHFQRLIHKYKQRAAIYKEKYGVNSKPYKNAMQRVYSYSRTLRINLKKREEIYKLAEQIKEYMGIDVKETKGKYKLEPTAARGIFCKYGLQQGLYSTEMARFLKVQTKAIARGRLSFTRKMNENIELKKIYYGFLQFVERKD